MLKASNAIVPVLYLFLKKSQVAALKLVHGYGKTTVLAKKLIPVE